MQQKKKVLGRGLSALLESPETDITTRDATGDFVMGAVAHLLIEHIEPNPFQPRSVFNEEELAELALSIQQQGIIQPVTVRKMGHDRYQLISGERRLKAARVAGLTEVPAYIRVASDEQMLEMALVENIQREDLNPIEIAASYQRLIDECHLSQEDLSQKVGKDRSTVSNYIRLLRLPGQIQHAISSKTISMGHARALITLDDPGRQLRILAAILKDQLSVRQVEELVKKQEHAQKDPSPQQKLILPTAYTSGKEVLTNRLHTDVELKLNRKGGGTILIPFETEEEFNEILSRL